MRKPRKGPGKSPVGPEPVPDPINHEERIKPPKCKMCEIAHANFLPFPAIGLAQVNVFCSWFCGAAYAVREHENLKIQWCPKHECWTGPQGRCQRCADDLYNAQIAASNLPSVNGAGEGVQHD